MKKNIITFAVATLMGLSVIAPASASMRLQALDISNADIITVGSHSHGGYRKKFRKHYVKPHKPKRHSHRHCHKRLVYGYWKKVCHRAWHNPYGHHHSHAYH